MNYQKNCNTQNHSRNDFIGKKRDITREKNKINNFEIHSKGYSNQIMNNYSKSNLLYNQNNFNLNLKEENLKREKSYSPEINKKTSEKYYEQSNLYSNDNYDKERRDSHKDYNNQQHNQNYNRNNNISNFSNNIDRNYKNNNNFKSMHQSDDNKSNQYKINNCITNQNINSLNSSKFNNLNFSKRNSKSKNSDIRVSYYGLENLPIMNHKEEILNLLNTEQVIIISGTTGCGKTTQVPKFIYEKLQNDFKVEDNVDIDNLNKKQKKILITQPRRIAAVSIAKRLSKELNCQLGQDVGYHVGLNPNYTSKTKIIICTTGIFLQKIINENSIKDYAYIIVDEVHERDCDIDLLLVMLKHLISKNKKIKLILMSATISIKLFSGYFNKFSIKNVEKTDKYQELKIGKNC